MVEVAKADWAAKLELLVVFFVEFIHPFDLLLADCCFHAHFVSCAHLFRDFLRLILHVGQIDSKVAGFWVPPSGRLIS